MRATSPILKNSLSGMSIESSGRPRRSAVQDVLQHLARLEGEDPARADRDLLAGLRIAADARILIAHHEVAEPGDLDLLPALERLLDRVEHHLHDLGRLLLREAADALVD